MRKERNKTATKNFVISWDYMFCNHHILISCSNSSHYVNRNNNKDKIALKYPVDSVAVPKLFVSGTSFFEVLDELIAYAEKHIPEYKKNSDEVFFEFGTHIQNQGIAYKVSLRGVKSFIDFSGSQYVAGALNYKNVLFIIRKTIYSNITPFSVLDEKMTLYNIPKGFITIYEMGNIKYIDDKYEFEIDFYKRVPKIK